MANVTTEILNRANGAAHDFKNKVLSSESNLEKMAHTAGEKLGAMTSNLTTSTSDYVNTGRDYVKENPAKGIAMAAAVGALAGSLLTLALRRSK